MQLFLFKKKKKKKNWLHCFTVLCFLTAQMLPAVGMDWTMKQEQSQLSATVETDIGGGIEKGTRMVSGWYGSSFPFFI